MGEPTVGLLLTPLWNVVLNITLNELVLLACTIAPGVLGVAALLRWLTNTEPTEEIAEDAHLQRDAGLRSDLAAIARELATIRVAQQPSGAPPAGGSAFCAGGGAFDEGSASSRRSEPSWTLESSSVPAEGACGDGGARYWRSSAELPPAVRMPAPQAGGAGRSAELL